MYYGPIGEFQAKQDLFNMISGKDQCFTYFDLKNQHNLIIEEGAVEGGEAFEEDDAVKLLDSVVDTLFVTLGALQKLRNAGFNVEGAMKQVADDNLSKFPEDEDVAIATIQKYRAEGIPATYDLRFGRFAIYNKETDKILKPTTFAPTDLTKYCPVQKISQIGV